MIRLNLILLLSLAVGLGCVPRRPRPDVTHPDMGVKIPSMVRAAERGDRRAIPLLIQDLEDSDPAIRFYAIEALHRLTGHRFGYDYFEDEPQRREAVQRWRLWLAEQVEQNALRQGSAAAPAPP